MISPEAPKFTYEEMTNPENRPGLEKVSSQMVDALRKYLTARLDIIYAQTARFGEKQGKALVANSREEMPKEIDLIEKHRGQGSLSKPERTILESFWGMAGQLQRTTRAEELDEEFRHLEKWADRDERRTIENVRAETKKNNIGSAEWENQAIRMIYSLRDSGAGKAFLRDFWQSLDQVSKCFKHHEREGERIRNGIFGVCATIDTLEALGFEVYLADPEQDAVEGIDLIAVMGNVMFIIQVKSHFGEKFAIEAEEVRQYDYSQKETKREQRLQDQRNKLLTGKERYGRLFSQLGIDCQVVPIWVEVTVNPNQREGQEPITGKVDLPSDFRDSEFAGQVYSAVEKGGGHVS